MKKIILNIKKTNIKKAKITKEKITKEKKKDISENLIPYNLNQHSNIINMLYLNEDFDIKKVIVTSIKKKLNGYKSQDRKKKRFDKEKFISYKELIEKMVISKLDCHYCRHKCCLLSNKKRDYIQWTLDRINNDIGHFTDNVVISCLKCNLQKRRRNDEHFKFAKQMRIIKHY